MCSTPNGKLVVTYKATRSTFQTRSMIRLRSFTGVGWYNIDLNQKTCDCPEFQIMPGRCKHLSALGIYPLKPFVAKPHPTFSQALSALVKSLRIRRVGDAVYWLVYLDGFSEPRYRFRTARRLLIGSAEDGHSIAVMEKVLEKFSKMTRLQTELHYLVNEAVRICKVCNWWHPSTGGPDYVYSSLLGERELAYFRGERSLQTMIKLIEQGIQEGISAPALAGLLGLSAAKVGGTKQAEIVLSLAKKYQHPLAERLAQIHLRAKSALSSDNNFLSQAVWMLAGGVSPVADVMESVSEAEVRGLLDHAIERWKAPRPIPGWCCDGVHSAGNDPRFMGTLPNMFAVCQAYEHYGRVDPDDVWLPEFQCYDGLMIETL